MKIDIKLILKRLQAAKNLRTDTELADFLGTTQGNIANWKTRNSINWEVIITNCDDLNLNWLVFGTGEMYQNDDPRLLEALQEKAKILQELADTRKGNLDTQEELLDVYRKVQAMLEKKVADLERENATLKKGGASSRKTASGAA